MARFLKNTELASRYAKALFDMALAQKNLEAVAGDMDQFLEVIKVSSEVRILLLNPCVSQKDRLSGLMALARALKFQDLTGKFLGVLSTNRRSVILPSVISGFQDLYAEHRGLIKAQVTSAIALSLQQKQDLSQAIGKAFGKTAAIIDHVAPELLGGLRVQVGSRLFDNSLKTKLNALKFALLRG